MSPLGQVLGSLQESVAQGTMAKLISPSHNTLFQALMLTHIHTQALQMAVFSPLTLLTGHPQREKLILSIFGAEV